MTRSTRMVVGGVLALLLLAACGGGEAAKKTEIAALEKQGNEGLNLQERLFDLKGEVASLRRQLKSMASDPLRSSLGELQQRLESTGTRLGLKVCRSTYDKAEAYFCFVSVVASRWIGGNSACFSNGTACNDSSRISLAER